LSRFSFQKLSHYFRIKVRNDYVYTSSGSTGP
jgi:hypothetical protein